MTEYKVCTYCGEELHRKRRGRKLESLRDFNKRQYCGISCSVKARQKPISEPDRLVKDAIEEAEAGIKSSNETRIKTGVEILRIMANDRTLDVITRLNAAKALAPYETRKASEIPGKKESKADAAKKAATGRFSAGPAPIIPFNRKDQS